MKRASHGPLTAPRPAAAQEPLVPAEGDRSSPTPARWGGDGKRSPAGAEASTARRSPGAEWLRVPALASPFPPAWRRGLTSLLQGPCPQALRVGQGGAFPFPLLEAETGPGPQDPTQHSLIGRGQCAPAFRRPQSDPRLGHDATFLCL